MKTLSKDDLRIRRVLEEKKNELGSYSKLAKAIKEANGGQGVDRRKLTAIVEGGVSHLGIEELTRIDAYLTRFGEGLAARPLFEQPDILMSLGDRDRVAFLVGAYPREARRRTDISRWDLRSVAELVREVNLYRGGTQFVIEDVIPRDPDEADADSEGASERWRPWVGDDQALICIGSPRACRATEVALAGMFEQTPFTAHVRGEAPLPFHFVWCPSERPGIETSRFVDHGDSIRSRHPELAARLATGDYRVAALVAEGESYPVVQQDDVGASWTDYGIVAVQRRARGGLWVALCGLSGPATFATARMLRKINARIPQPQRIDKHGPIMWMVIEAQIESIDLQGDNRTVVTERVHSGPRYWDPVRQCNIDG